MKSIIYSILLLSPNIEHYNTNAKLLNIFVNFMLSFSSLLDHSRIFASILSCKHISRSVTRYSHTHACHLFTSTNHHSLFTCLWFSSQWIYNSHIRISSEHFIEIIFSIDKLQFVELHIFCSLLECIIFLYDFLLKLSNHL